MGDYMAWAQADRPALEPAWLTEVKATQQQRAKVKQVIPCQPGEVMEPRGSQSLTALYAGGGAGGDSDAPWCRHATFTPCPLHRAL